MRRRRRCWTMLNGSGDSTHANTLLDTHTHSLSLSLSLSLLKLLPIGGQDDMKKRVVAMGGSFDANLTTKTTHLAAASSGTEKYNVATAMKVIDRSYSFDARGRHVLLTRPYTPYTPCAPRPFPCPFPFSVPPCRYFVSFLSD